MFLYFLIECGTDKVVYFNSLGDVINYCVEHSLSSDDCVIYEGVKR